MSWSAPAAARSSRKSLPPHRRAPRASRLTYVQSQLNAPAHGACDVDALEAARVDQSSCLGGDSEGDSNPPTPPPIRKLLDDLLVTALPGSFVQRLHRGGTTATSR